MDFAIELKLRHWWNHKAGGIGYRHSGQDYFKADSVQGLYELLRGTDTDYPQFEGFWADHNACQPEVRDGILHLLDYKNRSYTLDVDKTRVIEGAATYKHIDLDAPPDAGNVIDLSDEQNRDRYAQ